MILPVTTPLGPALPNASHESSVATAANDALPRRNISPLLPEVDWSQHFAVDLQLENVRAAVVPRHVQGPLRCRCDHRVALRVEDAVLFVQRARDDPSARADDHGIARVVPLLEVREELGTLRKVLRDV